MEMTNIAGRDDLRTVKYNLCIPYEKQFVNLVPLYLKSWACQEY